MHTCSMHTCIYMRTYARIGELGGVPHPNLTQTAAKATAGDAYAHQRARERPQTFARSLTLGVAERPPVEDWGGMLERGSCRVPEISANQAR